MGKRGKWPKKERKKEKQRRGKRYLKN